MDRVLSLADGGEESCMVSFYQTIQVDCYFIWKFLFFSVANTKGVVEEMNEVSVFALDFGALQAWLIAGSFKYVFQIAGVVEMTLSLNAESSL